MAIDWNAKLVTRDGRRVTMMGQDGWQKATGDTRRRVMPDKRSTENWPTVYLYHEDGSCRGDGQPSDNDLFNGDEAAAA